MVWRGRRTSRRRDAWRGLREADRGAAAGRDVDIPRRTGLASPPWAAGRGARGPRAFRPSAFEKYWRDCVICIYHVKRIATAPFESSRARQLTERRKLILGHVLNTAASPRVLSAANKLLAVVEGASIVQPPRKRLRASASIVARARRAEKATRHGRARATARARRALGDRRAAPARRLRKRTPSPRRMRARGCGRADDADADARGAVERASVRRRLARARTRRRRGPPSS